MGNPIGVFDFGIGGLTVVKEIMTILPNEDLIFLNDNANLWAGYKSEDSVRNDAVVANGFLLQFDIKAVVIACNTATAVALNHLKETNPVPTIGVIEPTARAASRTTRNNRIGVIGTNMTIRSNAYPKILNELNQNLVVSSKACPLLVPMIEEEFVPSEATRLVAMNYLSELRDKNIDTLILGCTHYSLIAPILSSILPDVTLVDPAPSTAEELRRVLMANNSLNLERENSSPKYAFFATDSNEKPRTLARNIFSKEFPDLETRFREARLEH